MTDRELMQQALYVFDLFYESGFDREDCFAVIKALRERLAQPQRTHWEGCEEVHPECRKPEQEPVAWMYHGIRHDDTPHERPSLIWKPEYMDVMSAEKGAKATPLYTTPPQRKPLTDEEIEREWQFLYDEEGNPPDHHDFARAIEAAHGIKGNT